MTWDGRSRRRLRRFTGKANRPLEGRAGRLLRLGALNRKNLTAAARGSRAAGHRRGRVVTHPPHRRITLSSSYANLATGRSPGFGSVMGSPEGGRADGVLPPPPLRLVAPKLMAWTAAAGEPSTSDSPGGGRSRGLRRSRTTSRRPIMQKVRLDTTSTTAGGSSDRSRA